MNINEIINIPFDQALTILSEYSKDKDSNIPANREAYDGKHAILADTNRLPKSVGDDAKNKRIVTPTNEVITFQKRIVDSAVEFLFGAPVSLILNNDENDAYDLITEIWKQNKLDYFNKKLARDLFIECKAAELWYIPQGDDIRIRVALLSARTGYNLYPHFDEFGDMDAFTIKYTTKDKEGKTVDTVSVYTADKIINATKKTGNDWNKEERPNTLGKIPVVYYEQDKPEWDGVSTEINRAEYLLSNFADTNDYFGSPVLQVKGIVTNLPRKEEMGKVVMVQPEHDADGKVYYPGGAEFVTWDQAPEALKTEYEILKDIIYSMTQTPDLSFQNVKGISSLSGVALRLMFSDSLFKARGKQEIFGPAMERRLSIIKSILGLTNSSQSKSIDSADIDAVFNDVLPQDIQALVASLSVARGGEAIMSEESAVRMNPLVTDPEKDIGLLSGEKSALKSFAESYA